MSNFEATERVYQAFLRGYQEFGTAISGAISRAPAVPFAWIIQVASVENKELRRSIDACRAALAQLPTLPDGEQAQLKIELRASLEALQSATEQLLAKVGRLRPRKASNSPPTDDPKPAPTRSPPVRKPKTRPRR